MEMKDIKAKIFSAEKINLDRNKYIWPETN